MVVPAAQHPLHQKDSDSTASIHELPVEILSAILLEVVTNPAEGSTPHLEQKAILNVSRHWRDVILSILGPWRVFWIRPSPSPTSEPEPAAASTTSPGPSGHAEGWLGLEEARRRLRLALVEPYGDRPVSITPTVIARDVVAFWLKEPLSQYLWRFPDEKAITDLDDVIMSAYQFCPADLMGRDFNISSEGKAVIRERHL
ncbi:hypothetical protein FRC00_006518, partial [Tulasnella sp. 408]